MITLCSQQMSKGRIASRRNNRRKEESHFGVFCYRAYAKLSEVINMGQNLHHHSIPQPLIMIKTKFQIIWCISKDFMAIYLIFGTFTKNVGWVNFPPPPPSVVP